MNIERLKVLVNIYMDRYAELIDDDFDTRRKWGAFSNCARKWDLEAEDFGKMFLDAMKKASEMIETDNVKPIEGIGFLCKNGKEAEVREAFEKLILRDSGDINERGERCIVFANTINALLEEVDSSRWQYKQKVRTAIRYLALIRPGENYLYKASEVAAFTGYCEVEEEIGYEKTLKLGNYYRMCDDVAEYIRSREDLLALVGKSLEEYGAKVHDKDLAHIDPAWHILVYDIISQSYQNSFYDEKAANRKSKVSTVAQRKIGRNRERARMLDERELVIDSFDEILALQEKAKIPDLTNKTAVHKAYGEGLVKSQDGRYLIVEFPEITKKFALPGAITNGYLNVEGSGNQIIEACKAMDEVAVRRREIEDRLNSIDVQLSMLE